MNSRTQSRSRTGNPIWPFRSQSKGAGPRTISDHEAMRMAYQAGKQGLGFEEWVEEEGVDIGKENIRKILKWKWEQGHEEAMAKAKQGRGGGKEIRYKGARIWRDEEGNYRTSVEPESEFESLPLVKRFVERWANPKGRPRKPSSGWPRRHPEATGFSFAEGYYHAGPLEKVYRRGKYVWEVQEITPLEPFTSDEQEAVRLAQEKADEFGWPFVIYWCHLLDHRLSEKATVYPHDRDLASMPSRTNPRSHSTMRSRLAREVEAADKLASPSTYIRPVAEMVGGVLDRLKGKGNPLERSLIPSDTIEDAIRRALTGWDVIWRIPDGRYIALVPGVRPPEGSLKVAVKEGGVWTNRTLAMEKRTGKSGKGKANPGYRFEVALRKRGTNSDFGQLRGIGKSVFRSNQRVVYLTNKQLGEVREIADQAGFKVTQVVEAGDKANPVSRDPRISSYMVGPILDQPVRWMDTWEEATEEAQYLADEYLIPYVAWSRRSMEPGERGEHRQIVTFYPRSRKRGRRNPSIDLRPRTLPATILHHRHSNYDSYTVEPIPGPLGWIYVHGGFEKEGQAEEAVMEAVKLALAKVQGNWKVEIKREVAGKDGRAR